MVTSLFRGSVALVIGALVTAGGCVVADETNVGTTSTTSATSGAGGGGGEGGHGGGGTIVIDDTGEDACPGDAYDLSPGDSFQLNGTTVGAADDYKSFCGDQTPEADGLDVVYALTLKGEGTLRLQITGDGFDPTLSLRATCDDEATTQGCFDYAPGEVETVLGHFTAGTYFVVVDGVGATSGDFSLAATLDAPECGDGVLNPAEEQCDPNPIDPEDGCSDPGAPTGGCKFEVPPIDKDRCPGEPVALTAAGLTLTPQDGQSTINFTDDYSGSCHVDMGGKDRVYAITPDVSGTMTVSVGFAEDGATPACEANPVGSMCWDAVLYLRSACDDTATELDCSDVGGVDPEIVATPVTAGTPYYLFVDGFDGAFYSSGVYNLTIALDPG